MNIDLASILSTIINGVFVMGLGASIGLLWRTSVLLAAVQAAQVAHDKADASRFEAVNQRIDDLRTTFRDPYTRPREH